MIEVTDLMKTCLRLAMQEDLSFEDTVVEAIKLNCAATGMSLQIDSDEEFFEYFRACLQFLVGEVVTSLILKGVVEVAGIQDDGELTFQLNPSYQDI